MKKAYSFLAMMLMASATYAQTLSATVDGKAVTNGETVLCLYDEIEKHPIPVVTIWEMAPHVVVKSDVEQEVSVGIDVLEKKGDDQVQNCFVNCIMANASNNYVVVESAKMAAGEEKDAGIHFSTKTNPNENPLERHVKVTMSTTSESLEFTLHMVWDPTGALSVGTINADVTNVPAYSITGVKVNPAELRTGHIYIQNGKKYIK